MLWYRTMPLRRRRLYDINQKTHPNEKGDDELPPSPPPFYNGVDLALAQFIADTTRHFAEAVAQISQPNERAENHGCSLCDFSSHHFLTFEGIEGPNVAEAWLTNIDVLFNIIDCTNKQRVQYIGLKLIGEASRWWTSRKVLLTEPPNETVITWDLFKIEYNRRFFPQAQRYLRAIEFQNLVQGNMSVEQYSAIFMELTRFTANLILDEESKAKRFENRLNPCIKEMVICLEIKEYVQVS
jgi:hypothetical protein